MTEKTVKDLIILVFLLPAKTEEHALKLAHMVFHVHVQKVGFSRTNYINICAVLEV